MELRSYTPLTPSRPGILSPAREMPSDEEVKSEHRAADSARYQSSLPRQARSDRLRHLDLRTFLQSESVLKKCEYTERMPLHKTLQDGEIVSYLSTKGDLLKLIGKRNRDRFEAKDPATGRSICTLRCIPSDNGLVWMQPENTYLRGGTPTNYEPPPRTPQLSPKPLDEGTLRNVVRHACKWAKSQEELALREGMPLSADEIEIARQMGVNSPEKVRVIVGDIPQPSHPTLYVGTTKLGLKGDQLNGITFGHGIFVKKNSTFNRKSLISHELRHVKQYEEFGSIRSFLSEYLKQLNEVGYNNSGFEVDAYKHQLET